LVNLLRACARVQRHPAAQDWVVVIAGWDQGRHGRELEGLVEELSLEQFVLLVGPQFEDAKVASYAIAEAFILPSLSEGLPVAVLEAWSYGVPVLMTEACNLPEGFAAGAALPIVADPAGIAAGLRRLFALSDAERRAMGARGQALVRERFTWQQVAEQMAAVYRWVLGGGPAPSCVLTC
jgi:poly(glycerol-phosphate) alpha-glucosyltransferase